MTDKMVVDDRIIQQHPARFAMESFKKEETIHTCQITSRSRSTCWSRIGRSSSNNSAILLLILAVLSWRIGLAEASIYLPPSASTSMDAYGPLREQEICPSIDIRNGPSKLSELKGCRVIEGFLHIVLIEAPDHTGGEFSNYTFPDLREITGYLLLYRVFGLRSIGQIFPNLAVIRGQQLLFDFSFVVYELMQLQEIGLKSLTELQRGSVLIEKNPNLCYVDTIDWARIGHSGRLNHFIQDNKKASECPKCPDRCPSGGDGRRLCWNSDDCQKVCDQCNQGGSGACSLMVREQGRPAELKCCHEECAGGCSGSQSNQCDVCKHVIHQKECRSVCPPGHYLFMKRRCVTDIECISMPPPREQAQEYPDNTFSWKVFGGSDVTEECILECPPGYQEEKKQHNSTLSYFTCVPCRGPCPKVCKGLYVNNIETVQKLRGCTIVDGDLDMQIKGGENIIQELERSLGSIEEIRGVLKIARSFPLLSLSFFKNLRNITGNQDVSEEAKTFYDDYALAIQDNQNLQQLWPSNQKLVIHKKMLFHFNPKLCYNLIEELIKSSQPPGKPALSVAETDISPWSNGDKATCDEQILEISVESRSTFGFLLKWDDFRNKLADKRQLLGYIISYIEAPNQNVTYYDGRDACGGDGWRVINVAATNDPNAKSEIFLMTNLKPYTQYAIFVQTYTVAPQQSGKRIGARSRIIYDRTKPAEPDRPSDLRANANSSYELVIEWKPPINPNGVVTHYIVFGSWQRYDQDYIDKHDPCAEQSISSTVTESKKTNEETSADNRTSIFGDPSRFGLSGGASNGSGNSPSANDPEGKCCQCSASNDKVTLEKKEKEQQFRIEFENLLQNKIYVKNSRRLRNKREIDATTETGENSNGEVLDEFPPDQPSNNQPDPVPTKEAGENHTNTYYRNRLVTFYGNVTGTSLTISGVRHYAEYTVEVRACHSIDSNNRTLCSKTAVAQARTKQSELADDIEGGVIKYESNYTTRSIKLGWNEPEDPNGLIIRYQLEYKRTDNAKVVKECVRRKDFIENNRTRLLVDLIPGNYCVQVRAYSMAGYGAPTKEVCFDIADTPSGLSGSTISVILFIIVLLVLVLGAGVIYFIIKNKKKMDDHGIISINPDYHKYVPDEWEVARDNVDLIRELGQGSFGMVYEGLLRKPDSDPPEVRCAVKTVTEKATIEERIQFLKEASVMKEFNAHHVLKLLGVVSKLQPTLVIMELMANGDLKSYLRSHRPDCDENVRQGREPPTLKCILKMAIEIADGMLYLSEKKYVHRDLAARNCMVADDLTVKIGDFGLTRDVYETDYYRKGGKGLLPVRWMAPESLRDGVYTSQCDVWSFGIVLWEMATLASQPYQGLSNEQVLKYVIEGGVMERPEGCPDRLYTLMESCWQHHAKRRPTFVELIENLLPDVPVQFASVSFYHSDAGVSARAALAAHYEQEIKILNDPSTPLQDLLDEQELEDIRRGLANHHYGSDQIVQIDDELEEEDEERPQASATMRFDSRRPVADADGEELSRDDQVGDQDHVPVLFPHERRAYILVRNPIAQVASNGNGSKSDSSKGTTSMASEDSKGSYVSNGSTSNGYVMGILKQRRTNNAEC